MDDIETVEERKTTYKDWLISAKKVNGTIQNKCISSKSIYFPTRIMFFDSDEEIDSFIEALEQLKKLNP